MSFVPSFEPGYYVSADGRYRAERRPAGWYSADLSTRLDARKDSGGERVKLTRHYAIRAAGSETVIGTAKTLLDAERYLP
jgi:hypothetical protein